jgi:hypothetical protein
MGDAVDLADEVVHVGGELQDLAGRLAQPGADRIDDLVRIAESDQIPRQLEALRGGPEELGLAQPRSPAEDDDRRIAGVAAVLPVDVPAGSELEVEAEADLAVARGRAVGSDQADPRLLVDRPIARRAPGRSRKEEEDDRQKWSAHMPVSENEQRDG